MSKHPHCNSDKLEEDLFSNNALVAIGDHESLFTRINNEPSSSPLNIFISAIGYYISGDFKEAVEDAKLLELSCNVCVEQTHVVLKNESGEIAIATTYYFNRLGHIYASVPGYEDTANNYFKKYHIYSVAIKPELAKPFIHAYSFRKVNEHTLADLANNTLTVVHPSLMNDPFDSLISTWLDYHGNISKNLAAQCTDSIMAEGYLRGGRIFKESFKYYRIRSFSKMENGIAPYANVLMWSHYADSHKGICIKYRIPPLYQVRRDNESLRLLYDISYDEPVVDITATSAIDGKDSFFRKAPEWEYEHERRLLTYDFSTESPYLSLPLDSENAIETVYFGIHCPEETKKMITNIMIGKGVKFFQMEPNLYDIYHLEAVEI